MICSKKNMYGLKKIKSSIKSLNQYIKCKIITYFSNGVDKRFLNEKAKIIFDYMSKKARHDNF